MNTNKQEGNNNTDEWTTSRPEHETLCSGSLSKQDCSEDPLQCGDGTEQ